MRKALLAYDEILPSTALSGNTCVGLGRFAPDLVGGRQDNGATRTVTGAIGY